MPGRRWVRTGGRPSRYSLKAPVGRRGRGETADVTARRLQSDRLRRHADDLRGGQVPIALLPAPTDAAYRPTPQIERTQLVLAEPILYLDEHLVPIRVIAGGVELPVPVADKAVELGIGHPSTAPKGSEF